MWQVTAIFLSTILESCHTPLSMPYSLKQLPGPALQIHTLLLATDCQGVNGGISATPSVVKKKKKKPPASRQTPDCATVAKRQFSSE